MFKLLTTSLTLLAVLACPLFCLSGGVCAAPVNNHEIGNEVSAVHCCSCCRHARAGEEEEGQHPLRPAQQRDCDCQCLCKGAVIDQADLSLDLLAVIPWVTAGDVATIDRDFETSIIDLADAPVRLAGLRARIAHCSLQR